MKAPASTLLSDPLKLAPTPPYLVVHSSPVDVAAAAAAAAAADAVGVVFHNRKVGSVLHTRSEEVDTLIFVVDIVAVEVVEELGRHKMGKRLVVVLVVVLVGKIEVAVFRIQVRREVDRKDHRYSEEQVGSWVVVVVGIVRD